MDKIKIILADDHNVLRQGIAQVLESQKDLEVIAQARSGEEVVELTKTLHPDLIIMDITMSEMTGLQAAEIIKGEYPDMKILILTMHKDGEYLYKAIEIGVDGYMLKEAEMDELLIAVRNVANGEKYIHSAIAGKLFSKIKNKAEDNDSPIKSLPKRDIQILKLIAKGMSNKEIAQQLYITEKTVRNRLSLLFQQYYLKNRTEAALWAISHGIVEEKD